MQELLYPLKLYTVDTGYSAQELLLHGQELDEQEAALELVLREAIITSAEDTGLDTWEELFPYRPICETVEERRAALSALMRVDGTKFTLAAINDTIIGSGVVATVVEADEAQTVNVTFAGVSAIPYGFDEISACIESIIPCHLNIEYLFQYTTWGSIDELAYTWGELSTMCDTFADLERI